MHYVFIHIIDATHKSSYALHASAAAAAAAAIVTDDAVSSSDNMCSDVDSSAAVAMRHQRAKSAAASTASALALSSPSHAHHRNNHQHQHHLHQHHGQYTHTEDSNDSFMNDKEDMAGLTATAAATTPTTSKHSGAKRPHASHALSSPHHLGLGGVDKTRLTECLDYLHRMISRKDKEDIFHEPVTDAIAPGYSLIIKKPMDLSTMKKKIDEQQYDSVSDYRVSDYSLFPFLVVFIGNNSKYINI